MVDSFIVVPWPESQNLMEQPGFDKNASLINDEPFLTEYGGSAYFVRESWIKEIHDVEK